MKDGATLTSASPSGHRLTVVAIAVLAYGVANIAHEGVGHGLVCFVLGGDPQVLSSVHFEGTDPVGGAKWVSAGGTLSNIALGGVALLARRATPPAQVHWRYFLWLSVMINFLQAAGYFLFSGIGNIGDWAAVLEGVPGRGVLRVVMALSGLAFTLGTVWLGLKTLAPLLPPRELGQHRRAIELTVVPYVAGGALYLVSGALNPLGPLILLISAAAASFGGTAGLAWMAQMLKTKWLRTPGDPEALPVSRSLPWLVAAALMIAVFVGVLGPGISF